MNHSTYIPCDSLKPYVKKFTIQELELEQAYTVLPDTCLVMGLQYKGSLAYFEDKQEIPLSPFGVTGLRDSFRIFKNSPGIGSVLIFFKEGGAAAFFQQPLHELFRESISLENFMLRSTLSLVEEQLLEAKTNDARIQVVEEFLIARISSFAFEQDKLVMAALQCIHKEKGNIRISELAECLHTSQSPLEKRFRKVVGASPKKYASIVRLKHMVESFKPGISIPELGFDAGYYDQSHFIKQFKTFTGLTPEKFFKSTK